MAQDVFKRDVSSLSQAANIVDTLTRFSKTLGAYIPVASVTEANAVASKAPAGTVWPLHFWNTATNRPMVKLSSTSSVIDEAATVPDNSVYIDGAWYALSGTQQMPSASWNHQGNSWYATTLNIPWPYTPPPGYGFSYQADATTGYTLIMSVNRGTRGGYTVCRMLNYANENPHVSTVVWQLVKVA